MMLLALDGVGVSLGGQPVVRNVSARFGRGRLVSLAGPNGVGKTTLLRAIAGLVPHAGRIALDGQEVGTLSPRQRARGFAYLPQGHAAYWPLPVRDIVALGRTPHGAMDPARLPAADAAAVTRVMHATGVHDLADRPVTLLSGGERARVALARVLAVEAPVILADEPTAALDPRYQIEVMALLAAAAQDGALVIAVTHDLGLAARYADEVLVMAHGAVAAHGPPDAALSPEVLRDVFGVAAFRAEHAGRPVLVPWAST